MDLRASAFRISFLLARGAIWLITSILTLYGTYLAAYSDFGSGMALFWLGCLLSTIMEGYWIYRLVYGRFDATRVYMRSLLSIILSAVLGYGGAYVFYHYATSASLSNPMLAALLPPHAVSVLVLTSVIFATLHILFASARAIAAYHVSHSRLARIAELSRQPVGKKIKA